MSMSVVFGAIVAAQFIGLVVGCVQGWRYRHSLDVMAKAFPWLAVGIMGAPIITLIKAFTP